MKATALMFSATLRQLLGGKRLIFLGLLTALPAVVMALIGRGSSPARAFMDFHGPPMAILLLILLPIVSLVFGASALGDERRDQTLSFLVLRPVPRTAIVVAKLLAAWVASFLLVAVGGVAAAVVQAIYSGHTRPIGPVVLAVAISALAYSSVFLLVGYLTNRAVLIGLAYFFIWESGITMGVASLATVSLFRIGLTAYLGLVPEASGDLNEALGSATPGAGGAMAKAAVIAALATLLTTALLRRRDVT